MDPRKEKLERVEKKALSLLDEFRQFAFKGNVVDLAVGVIIGAAFGKLVSSLVENIIMPTINLIVPGEHSYTNWALTIDGKAIPFGKFLGDVLNFLIVAFAVYLFIVKFLGWIMRNRETEPTIPPPLTKEQELLTEIRDLLKKGADQPKNG
jgi:large conductance mechanosensitive channel